MKFIAPKTYRDEQEQIPENRRVDYQLFALKLIAQELSVNLYWVLMQDVDQDLSENIDKILSNALEKFQTCALYFVENKEKQGEWRKCKFSDLSMIQKCFVIRRAMLLLIEKLSKSDSSTFCPVSSAATAKTNAEIETMGTKVLSLEKEIDNGKRRSGLNDEYVESLKKLTAPKKQLEADIEKLANERQKLVYSFCENYLKDLVTAFEHGLVSNIKQKNLQEDNEREAIASEANASEVDAQGSDAHKVDEPEVHESKAFEPPASENKQQQCNTVDAVIIKLREINSQFNILITQVDNTPRCYSFFYRTTYSNDTLMQIDTLKKEFIKAIETLPANLRRSDEIEAFRHSHIIDFHQSRTSFFRIGSTNTRRKIENLLAVQSEERHLLQTLCRQF